MKRDFRIPTLWMVAATGCTGETFVGDWRLQSLTDDGNRLVFPYVYEATEDGVTYTYTTDYTLAIDADEQVELVQRYSIAGPGYADERLDIEAGSWIRVSRNRCELDFDDDSLDMDCTEDGGELVCETRRDALTMVFIPD